MALAPDPIAVSAANAAWWSVWVSGAAAVSNVAVLVYIFWAQLSAEDRQERRTEAERRKNQRALVLYGIGRILEVRDSIRDFRGPTITGGAFNDWRVSIAGAKSLLPATASLDAGDTVLISATANVYAAADDINAKIGNSLTAAPATLLGWIGPAIATVETAKGALDGIKP